MTPAVDPFMAPTPTGIQRGRGGFLRSKDDSPYVSDPSGEVCKTGARKSEIKRLKYGSFSKTGTLIENDVGLTKHKQRNTLLGIGMSVDLVEACRDLVAMEAGSDEFRKAADTIVVEADNLTRSWLAADRGTHGHLLCEIFDREEMLDRAIVGAGEEVGLDQVTQTRVIGAWRDLLAANGLEILAIEAPCVDDRWKLAGTLDRIVRCTRELRFAKPDGEVVVIPAGTVLILDLKFGKVRLAHAIQVAGYRQSVPYDTDLEQRGEWPWPISAEHALIAHGDFGDEFRPPSFELVWVDLVAGREHGGQCVVDAKAWAARDDVFSVAQIVEGVSGQSAVTRPTRSPAPSTPSSAGMPDPSAPLTVGEEAGAAAGHSPAMSILVPTGGLDSDGNLRGTADPNNQWPLADPDRLALVDARGQLCATPDEGADLSVGFDELWDKLRTEFDALDPVAKAWRSQLAVKAKQRGVSFMAQEGKTERRYHINKGLIALAIVDADDDILRAILAIVLGDIAWFVGIEPGHLVGSLNHVEAAKFADLCDTYISPPPAA